MSNEPQHKQNPRIVLENFEDEDRAIEALEGAGFRPEVIHVE